MSGSHSSPPVRLRHTLSWPSTGKWWESLVIGTTYTVSGSWAWTSMAKPKSVGRLPLTSRHVSPASSVRMTSQCFCMNRVSGRAGCRASRWTQCPTSAFGSGIPSERRPWLIGFHEAPASSERKAPAAEIAA